MSETVLVNLLSEQRLPNFIAVMQEQPDRVLALCTPQFAKEAERFGNVTGTPTSALAGTPYDLRDNLDRLLRALESAPAEARILINFTGGTKIMAIAAVFAALSARQRRRIELLYVETTGSQIDRFGFDEGGRFQQLESEKITVHIPFEAYAGLLGEPIKPGALSAITPDIEERHAVAEALLDQACDGYFKNMKNAFQRNARGREEPKTEFATGFSHERHTGRIAWNAQGGEIAMPSGKRLQWQGPDAGRFFCGGWMEEYCFHRLARSTRFRQVRMNVTLEIKPGSLRNPQVKLKDKTELDVVVCDGVRAAIIECKTGAVKAEDLHRLAAITRYLLGSLGVPVLASRFPLADKEREIAESHDIRVIHGPRISDLPKQLTRWFTEA